MLVLAAVCRAYAVRLRRAAGSRFRFLAVSSWTEAVDLIRQEAVELVVAEPGLEGTPRSQEIERIRVLFPSLPLVVYTRLRPQTVPVFLRLGQTGIREVIVADHDDHPDRLIDLLLSAAARAVSRRLMREIEDVVRIWPGELRWAVETMIREPASLHTVQELADRARMDRRTCARWFTKAGLPPPSVMLMVFRIAYAHRLLQDPGYTIEDVATRLGYSKARPFAQHVKEVFGMTPGELRVSLTPEAAITKLRERYFSSGRTAATAG